MNTRIGVQPNLSLEQVSSLEISMPPKDEQEKNREYFAKLDYLIAFHQRTYEGKICSFKELV